MDAPFWAKKAALFGQKRLFPLGEKKLPHFDERKDFTMFKLFKNFTKKDYLLILICLLLIVFQVWLDLKLPDYMSEITILVKTEGSTMSDILEQGCYMLLWLLLLWLDICLL